MRRIIMEDKEKLTGEETTTELSNGKGSNE